MRFLSCLLTLVTLTGSALADDVRLQSGVSGHIHPALAVTKKGTLVAVFCQKEYKPYQIVRSTDGGKTWSAPELFPHTVSDMVYPGSLTTLSDGRLLHAWNVWYTFPDGMKSRYVAYSLSDDEGKTWSEPRSLQKPAESKPGSVIRHPVLELSPTEWVFSLADRTVSLDPTTGKETTFATPGHGLVPIVRTVKGTLISGKGLRSTDRGKSWTPIKGFPDIATQGWRHQLVALPDGSLLASHIVGPGFGGEKILFVPSRDDGNTWDMDSALEFYNPNRAIGGRACPRSVWLGEGRIGTAFYDIDMTQPGGPGVFFRVSTWK